MQVKKYLNDCICANRAPLYRNDTKLYRVLQNRKKDY